VDGGNSTSEENANAGAAASGVSGIRYKRMKDLCKDYRIWWRPTLSSGSGSWLTWALLCCAFAAYAPNSPLLKSWCENNRKKVHDCYRRNEQRCYYGESR